MKKALELILWLITHPLGLFIFLIFWMIFIPEILKAEGKLKRR